jgi:SpoVK/Ycf46/Vps4 family AAA+-type ATPase
MLNRHNRNKMNPTRINNYNKFLSTLDQKSNLNENEKNAVKILSEKFKDSTVKESTVKDSTVKESTVKDELDKIIDKLNNSFIMNNISYQNFTGQTPNDNCCIKNIDPNYYRDINNHKIIYLIRPNIPSPIPLNSNKSCDKPSEKPVEIRETINIEAEVNNINDILKLVDTYQNDPAIKYNINMKALHDIKEPLEELNNMIGMKDLKNNIVDQILYFVQELHKGNLSSGDFMHTVIYGPPGTGKTEIAKIMGKIYSKIGILNKGTFKKVTRSDLIAGYLGQTAIKTKDVIKEALGGVLFIDEAYSLGNPEKKDSFAKECIDTLCEALSDNKENLMVIVAGYEKELKESFFSFNQGLDSRFTWRFKTDDYTAEDLHNIFLKKVKDIGWELDPDAKISVDWFRKNNDYFKFYGRDIETVLAKTKIAHSKRVFCRPDSEKKKITIKDLDKGFEVYLKNDDVKNRKDEKEFKKNLYNTLYS